MFWGARKTLWVTHGCGYENFRYKLLTKWNVAMMKPCLNANCIGPTHLEPMLRMGIRHTASRKNLARVGCDNLKNHD